uniref:RING-type domain-containing protein n=1 Tax=Angiostrongylus cantonensis TaxID=6313 RepID=A0A0K0D927_ANGCA
MFRTAISMCTRKQLKEESPDLARQINISNGYEMVTRGDMFKRRVTPQDQTLGQKKIPFTLPFISDEASIATKRCFRRAGLEESVALVEISLDTFRCQLVRNRLYDCLCETESCVICPFGRDGDCMSSGAIYLISCGACEDEYISETGIPLCICIKEHLDGKGKLRQSTPLGTHKIQKYSGDDVHIKVTIVAQDTKTLACKLLEAFWINSKNPKMNSREECPEITRDLAPYLRIDR